MTRIVKRNQPKMLYYFGAKEKRMVILALKSKILHHLGGMVWVLMHSFIVIDRILSTSID